MPAYELDENEYAAFQRYQQSGMGTVLDKVAKHPEARTLAQRAILLAAPEQAGPEIRVRQEAEGQIAEVKKTIDEFIAEQRKDRDERAAAENTAALQSRWNAGIAKLRASGYGEEGIEAIGKLMEDRGIADHEAAAALYERMNPPPAPIMSSGTGFDFFGGLGEDGAGEALKMLIDSRGEADDAFLGRMVPIAINEARGGQR